MGNFNRGGRSGGGRGGFGKRSFGGGGGRGFGGGFGDRNPQMHDAVCSKCGNACQVPFKPTGDRPVFCDACFKSQPKESFRREGGSGFSRPSFSRPEGSRDQSAEQNKTQFAQINSKLDKILLLLNAEVGEILDPKVKSVQSEKTAVVDKKVSVKKVKKSGAVKSTAKKAVKKKK